MTGGEFHGGKARRVGVASREGVGLLCKQEEGRSESVRRNQPQQVNWNSGNYLIVNQLVCYFNIK